MAKEERRTERNLQAREDELKPGGTFAGKRAGQEGGGKGKEKKKSKRATRETIEAVLIAILLALFIRTFVIQAFKIPSGSMENTLLVGDHLIVSKFAVARLEANVRMWSRLTEYRSP